MVAPTLKLSDGDLSNVISGWYGACCQLTASAGCTLFMHDSDSMELVEVVGREEAVGSGTKGDIAASSPRNRPPVTLSLLGAATPGWKTVVADAAQHRTNISIHDSSRFGREGGRLGDVTLRNLLAIPFDSPSGAGQLLGVCLVYNKKHGAAFNLADEERMREVLCLAAEVLENRQLTRDYGELARDFHELKRTGSKLLQLGAAVEVNRRTMDPESFRRRGSIVA